MNERENRECEQVLLAVMASLDGEAPALPAERIEAHLADCAECRAAVAPMQALQHQLEGLTWSGPPADLWPAVGARIGHHHAPARYWIAFVLVAVVCVVWRTGQLVLDLPLPVVNAVVPLSLSMLLVRWLVGDPLAISDRAPDLRQERA
jgi:hypothetical protein